eukprot:scaffold10481_cov68-Cyclotella_meneghiniana.AAC.1
MTDDPMRGERPQPTMYATYGLFLVVGSARPPASWRTCLVPLSAEGRRPRHDAVGSVRRTLGLQQRRDWSSALAEPYRHGCSGEENS